MTTPPRARESSRYYRKCEYSTISLAGKTMSYHLAGMKKGPAKYRPFFHCMCFLLLRKEGTS